MSGKIDAREVLKCLNELGYTGITAHQLKEFMKDLKKLIKYEARLQHDKSETTFDKNEKVFTSAPENSYFSANNTVDELSALNMKKDVFEYLYSKGTVASEAKKMKSKENVISVEIKTRNELKMNPHVHCVHNNRLGTEVSLSRHRCKSDSDIMGHTASGLENTMSAPSVRSAASFTESTRDTIDGDRTRTYLTTSRNKNQRPKSSCTYEVDVELDFIHSIGQRYTACLTSKINRDYTKFQKKKRTMWG